MSYATEHRCGVVVRGPGLSDKVSGTDPLKDQLPILVSEPLDDSPEVRGEGGRVRLVSELLGSACFGAVGCDLVAHCALSSDSAS